MRLPEHRNRPPKKNFAHHSGKRDADRRRTRKRSNRRQRFANRPLAWPASRWQGPGAVACPSHRTATSGGARLFVWCCHTGPRMGLVGETSGFAGRSRRRVSPSTIRQRRAPSAQPQRRRTCRSDVELCLEYLVDGLRVRLAPGRLHHLAYEPSDHCGLRFRLSRLVGIAGNDIIDELFDRGCVGHLL
jgi:hypothetical protein